MEKQETKNDRPGQVSLLGTAGNMGLHLVSGPIVGSVLGYLLDTWLGLWPYASAVGFFLGIIAGFRNVWADYKYLQKCNAEEDAAKSGQIKDKAKDRGQAETKESETGGKIKMESERGGGEEETVSEYVGADVLSGTKGQRFDD